MSEEIILDESDVFQIRKQKLDMLRKSGFGFPNRFKRTHLASAILSEFHGKTKEELASLNIIVSVAGRMVLQRVMGKASFFHLQDTSGRIQAYIKENELPEAYAAFKHWDLGDILGVEGKLFVTNTGELSIHVNKIELLTKALRPLPDKFHGLSDQEMRYRKRYVDLIANEATRKVFITRTRLVKALRDFMDKQQFLEVETPMMHPIPGGAIARPFVTHHNTLDRQLFLRIAPELYLKRLVVGGFERVYEINRNFRNEGISTRHNPEFTMIEFYAAYLTYHDLMDFSESLLRFLCDEVLATRQIVYQGHTIDFDKPFERLTMTEAIVKYNQAITFEQIATVESCRKILDNLGFAYHETNGLGQLQLILFEETVEKQLIQPTFITQYPTEASPLARASDADPNVTDRFELFIVGRELANGFSELNDPEDQAARFKRQVESKDRGDLEAMHYDSDYIEALEYGMPPTAGEGIGIDRLVMLFTDSPSIRDVILFPQLRQG